MEETLCRLIEQIALHAVEIMVCLLLLRRESGFVYKESACVNQTKSVNRKSIYTLFIQVNLFSNLVYENINVSAVSKKEYDSLNPALKHDSFYI